VRNPEAEYNSKEGKKKREKTSSNSARNEVDSADGANPHHRTTDMTAKTALPARGSGEKKRQKEVNKK